MPTLEEKISMMERGFWFKCANPSCSNPANKNRKGSVCSNKCKLYPDSEWKRKFLANHPRPKTWKQKLTKKQKLKKSRRLKPFHWGNLLFIFGSWESNLLGPASKNAEDINPASFKNFLRSVLNLELIIKIFKSKF